MHKALRQVLTKTLAVTATAAIAVVGMGAPALADTSAANGIGAAAKMLTKETTKGLDVVVKELSGKQKKVPTGLHSLKPKAGKPADRIRTYCADYSIAVKADVSFVENSWKSYPAPVGSVAIEQNLIKVNWIIQHSYPTVPTLERLAQLLSIQLISKEVAIAATQLAIWHYTNGIVPGGDNNALVLTLYQKLITGAEANAAVSKLTEPLASLTLVPLGKTHGYVGDKIGPFLVKTTATVAILKLEGLSGLQLVDARGNTIERVANDTKVWVKVKGTAKVGKANLVATVNLGVNAGRIFTGGKTAQPQIVAGDSTTPTVVTVEIIWDKDKDHGGTKPSASPSNGTPSTPVPSTTNANGGGSLPLTGSNVALFGAAGAVLLLLGGGLFFFARKRRSA